MALNASLLIHSMNYAAEICNYYEEEVLRSDHFPQKWYRGSELTLVILDTHSDGNQYCSYR